MMRPTPVRRISRTLPLVLLAASFFGCESSYSVDIRNQTSQPLYANIIERTENGSFNRATTRLGPGDRGAVGPVTMRTGRAMLIVDTKGNPTGPPQLDLSPGTSVVQIEQDSDNSNSPIHLRDLTR